MRGIKSVAAAAAILASTMLAGCSLVSNVQEMFDTATAASGEEVVAEAESVDGIVVRPETIDRSIPLPEFTADLTGITNVTLGAPVTLDATATVTDGGTVTYQWYSNSVEKNGGGTLIPGAESATYNPDTSAGGTTFYYCVVSNNHNELLNKITSGIHAVKVWDNMYWQQNADNGGFQYLSRADGSYPTNTSLEIDGLLCSFDGEGYAIDENGEYVDIASLSVYEDAVAESAEEAPAEDAEAPADDKAAEKSSKEESKAESASSSSEG